MNTRSLYVMAGATALVAVIAAVTLKGRESAVQANPGGAKLFPELPASINDVTAIEVKRKDATYTLQRTGEAWGLAEKKGYPVDMAAVRKSLIGISELTTAEEKTDDPKQYAKIGVEDPGTEGSTSTGVTLRDAQGKELAALIVGKERTSKSFSAPRQVYVRKAGDARSWLANGEVQMHEKSTEWLDKKIVEVKRDRVRAVEIRHADGEVVLVDREQPETTDFTLHDIPEGKELSYPTAPGAVASALEWLNLEDVSPAGEVDMSTGTTATAKFSCFDGLTVQVVTKNEGEKTYARFEAAFEEPPAKAGPPTPDRTADETTASSQRWKITLSDEQKHKLDELVNAAKEINGPDSDPKLKIEAPELDGSWKITLSDEQKKKLDELQKAAKQMGGPGSDLDLAIEPSEIAAKKSAEPTKPAPKSPEEVRKEVEQLNARLSQWTYVIPAYNKTSFEKRKSELVKDKAPPAPEKPAETPHVHAPGEPPHAENPKAPEGSGEPPSTPPVDDGAKPETPPESKPPR